MSLIVICCSTAGITQRMSGREQRARKPQAQLKTETSYISEQKYSLDAMPDKSIQVLRYNMPNVQGKQGKATALLIFPQTPQPKDGWRVVVWEHMVRLVLEIAVRQVIML